MPRLPRSVALAAAVADLTGDDQRLLVVLDGLVHLAQVAIGNAQVAQVVALAAAVADLTGDDQRLLVVLDGLLHLAEVGIGIAQVAQVGALRRGGRRSHGR